MDHSFHRAARGDELSDGAPLGVVVNGWPVLLARSAGKVHAMIDRCPHAASSLSSGRLRRGTVMCPLHGARFDLESGQCIGGAYQPLMMFATRSDAEWIEVAVPDQPPRLDQKPVPPPSLEPR